MAEVSLASDKILNTFLNETRAVEFVPLHLHCKYIRTGSLNDQHEQEERLQQAKTCFSVYRRPSLLLVGEEVFALLKVGDDDCSWTLPLGAMVNGHGSGLPKYPVDREASPCES